MRSAVAVFAFALTAFAARGATFVVSNTADSGPASLRQAIIDANATPGVDAIDFSIGTGPQTINVGSPLVVTSPLIIDGATQEGFAATPLITLFGTGTGNGLEFAAGADGSAVRNLELASFYGSGFFDAAAIEVTGANNVSIAGNFIGGVRGFIFRNRAGIRISSVGNTIGGLTASERNVFVNESHDVHIRSSASGNVVRGNYFGFDQTGLVPQFPATIAIWIDGGSDNVVGGTEAGARNVLIASGNGVQITKGAAGNRVQGNYIGLRADGLAGGTMFPGTAGVTLSTAGGMNLIGGTTAAARNVIGNNAQGISIGSAAGVHLIHGNFIGTNPAGTAAIPNGSGVLVASFGSSVPVTIGGTAPGEGNLISGNVQYGVYLSSAVAQLQGNYIGTDVTGLAALPNGGSGVHLQHFGAAIGTGNAAGRNVIAGNARDGIEGSVLQFFAGNAISGNYIGVGADGVTPLPNGGHGIALATTFGAPRIESNVIAHNATSGVHLTAVNDAVIGGTAATANRIASNQGDGVVITGSSLRNVIGANSIDTNGGLGIDLADDGVTPPDAGDGDSGPNALQNFPSLARAVGGTGGIVVTGTLSSTPNTPFTLDFYASPAADPSGFGEGARHLGSTNVATDASGQAMFAATVSGAAPDFAITATATSAASGTSEFSNAVVLELAGTVQFSSSAYATEEGNTVTITVMRLGGSAGTVTVDYATSDGTAVAAQDYLPASGTLTFVEGQTTATFTISTLADSIREPNETVQLTLSNATGGATIASPSQATLTIAAAATIPTLNELATLALIAALGLLALRSLRMA